MVSGFGDFIFADDFDVVMAILEEDESVEEQFLEVVQTAPAYCLGFRSTVWLAGLFAKVGNMV